MSNSEKKVIYKSFKERYHNDPEYRGKHLSYLKEKISCECGVDVNRAGMIAHKQTPKHQSRMMAKQTEPVVSKKEYLKLKKELEELKSQKTLKNIQT